MENTSPLRNNVNAVDDYESGMEASESSMAEENQIEPMGEKRKHHYVTKRKHTNPTKQSAVGLIKQDEIPTPSSGYEGDTEGPLNEGIEQF
ncbi:hypothetical protein G6F46_008289 [Rhizopus delemar]|uniref:Uncharacterized protein n=2 Tax=Rhizopus TaxID=4842 RepID=A0A9P6YTB6_9FUNG|nr:hypothetical protein G6F43_003801 [Rhizopus delemar]KAG1540355.1 hypothetical protein G6F51_008572 [Rhizopus arrhizus]KAG1447453.1 hypothetical protein G6F55_011094 [Rhizopus delemar]KAG1489646.1 hypothetical protein G6F54_011286 [Rhizopus delemar]KAG1499919.1 hypothetical protein G6F53_011417 [Rhizopus delemar]